MKKKLEEIARDDGRFAPQALRFVYEGLGYTTRESSTDPNHVSGQILCRGLAKLALEKWGRLAMLVLNSWNLKTTRDFGEIVYLMINHKWMSSQASDRIEDFDDIYDFKTTFEDQFRFDLKMDTD